MAAELDEEQDEDEDGDDEIIGDEKVADRPAPARPLYSGGMPLPSADDDGKGASKPSGSEPGTPMARNDEEELLQRVAELLKDVPAAGQSHAG